MTKVAVSSPVVTAESPSWPALWRGTVAVWLRLLGPADCGSSEPPAASGGPIPFAGQEACWAGGPQIQRFGLGV